MEQPQMTHAKPDISDTPAPRRSEIHHVHKYGESHIPCCGYFWLLLFPCGLLCCLQSRIRVCQECGNEIGDAANVSESIHGPSYRTGVAIGAISAVV